MPVDRSMCIPGSLKTFKWQMKSIKYLGSYISADKSQLYRDNFLPSIKAAGKVVK